MIDYITFFLPSIVPGPISSVPLGPESSWSDLGPDRISTSFQRFEQNSIFKPQRELKSIIIIPYVS